VSVAVRWRLSRDDPRWSRRALRAPLRIVATRSDGREAAAVAGAASPPRRESAVSRRARGSPGRHPGAGVHALVSVARFGTHARHDRRHGQDPASSAQACPSLGPPRSGTGFICARRDGAADRTWSLAGRPRSGRRRHVRQPAACADSSVHEKPSSTTRVAQRADRHPIRAPAQSRRCTVAHGARVAVVARGSGERRVQTAEQDVAAISCTGSVIAARGCAGYGRVEVAAGAVRDRPSWDPSGRPSLVLLVTRSVNVEVVAPVACWSSSERQRRGGRGRRVAVVVGGTVTEVR